MAKYGLMSGKYDSTHQRAVLLNGNRLRNYRSYSLTMRMEMLLTGRLNLTEPMFFDGLYFQWACSDPAECGAISALMVKTGDNNARDKVNQLIDVKCKDVSCDVIVKRMYSKQFLYSSIIEPELQRLTYELGNDFEEKYSSPDKKDKSEDKSETENNPKPFSSIDSFDKLKVCFFDKKDDDKEYLGQQWEEYTKVLKSKFGLLPLGKWGDNGYLMEDFLDQEIALFFPGYGRLTYRKRLLALVDEAECEMSGKEAHKYFCRIKDEINCNFKTRSKFVASISALEHLNEARRDFFVEGSDDSIQRVNGYFREMKQILNDRTNKTYAYQHDCEFLDICDYTDLIKNLHFEGGEYVDLPPELINNLAEMSWQDFKTWLENPNVIYEMNKWMSIFYRPTSIDSVKNALEYYISFIKTSLDKITISGSNKSKPWNYKSTCVDDLNIIDIFKSDSNNDTMFNQNKKSIYYFVSGGSYEKGEEGNEICLLCRDNNSILRIRLEKMDHQDDDLNTLIAPVKNIYNGN